MDGAVGGRRITDEETSKLYIDCAMNFYLGTRLLPKKQILETRKCEY